MRLLSACPKKQQLWENRGNRVMQLLRLVSKVAWNPFRRKTRAGLRKARWKNACFRWCFCRRLRCAHSFLLCWTQVLTVVALAHAGIVETASDEVDKSWFFPAARAVFVSWGALMLYRAAKRVGRSWRTNIGRIQVGREEDDTGYSRLQRKTDAQDIHLDRQNVTLCLIRRCYFSHSH